ncbi:KPYM-like protein [Mya arenaria]|uniref:KPYM-like protein n=1 Tax=Mya arenaria TaxID=6604 RepID=A0ABY7G7X3_MYAAR|nr:KPYM-like protein [Mya arenaria]
MSSPMAQMLAQSAGSGVSLSSRGSSMFDLERLEHEGSYYIQKQQLHAAYAHTALEHKCKLDIDSEPNTYHEGTIKNIRAAVAQFSHPRPVAIALDTKGPEIRTGILEGGSNNGYPLQEPNSVVISITGVQQCFDIHNRGPTMAPQLKSDWKQEI